MFYTRQNRLFVRLIFWIKMSNKVACDNRCPPSDQPSGKTAKTQGKSQYSHETPQKFRQLNSTSAETTTLDPHWAQRETKSSAKPRPTKDMYEKGSCSSIRVNIQNEVHTHKCWFPQNMAGNGPNPDRPQTPCTSPRSSEKAHRETGPIHQKH